MDVQILGMGRCLSESSNIGTYVPFQIKRRDIAVTSTPATTPKDNTNNDHLTLTHTYCTASCNGLLVLVYYLSLKINPKRGADIVNAIRRNFVQLRSRRMARSVPTAACQVVLKTVAFWFTSRSSLKRSVAAGSGIRTARALRLVESYDKIYCFTTPQRTTSSKEGVS
jgi:hypothetical protein